MHNGIQVDFWNEKVQHGHSQTVSQFANIDQMVKHAGFVFVGTNFDFVFQP
jgi:hypothetical protein